MKLPRPYIPLAVRLKVAERQLGRSWKITGQSDTERLGLMLKLLFPDDAPFELHHRPALCNRHRRLSGRYIPDANDPDYLVYLPEHEHDIETRVRGVGAQLSDLGKLRKEKRRLRKLNQEGRTRNRKRWPSRPFPKRAK